MNINKKNTGFCIALLTVLFLSIYSYQLIRKSRENEERVRHTYIILQTNKELLSNVKDAETGIRGYVLAQNSKFLEPYFNSNKAMDSVLQRLKSLVSGNNNQEVWVGKLENLINEKNSFNQKVLYKAKNESFKEAMLLIQEGEGREKMDNIRFISKNIDDNEKELLDKRTRATDEAIKNAELILLLGTTCSICLLLIIFFALYKETRRRRKNEEELFIRNEWYNQTLISLGDGVITVDTDGIITMINRAGCDITGWTQEQAIGQHIELVFVITSESSGKVVANPVIKAMALNKISLLENHTFMTKKNGSKISIDDSGAPIHDSEGRIIGGVLIFRDISQKKKIEEELKLFYNISTDMIGIASTEGYFTRVNPSFERILGYSANEFISKKFIDYVHFMDVEKTTEEVQKLSNGIATQGFVNRYACLDGSYKWLEWNITPFEEDLYCIARDITERQETSEKIKQINLDLEKKFEQRTSDLQRQKDFINDILNRIQIEILVYDTSLNFLYVNQMAVSEEEVRKWLIGRKDEAFCNLKKIGKEEIDERAASFITVKEDQPVQWTEKRINDNSSLSYILYVLYMIGENRMYILTGYDITGIKNAEAERNQHTAVLEETIFMTSHKIRHSLAQITGISSLLTEELTQEEFIFIVNNMKEAVTFLNDFTKELTLFLRQNRTNDDTIQ